jgi:hypothetical protein
MEQRIIRLGSMAARCRRIMLALGHLFPPFLSTSLLTVDVHILLSNTHGYLHLAGAAATHTISAPRQERLRV